MITADMVKPGAAVVGRRVSLRGQVKHLSDVTDEVAEGGRLALALRIGGVGPMTRAMLRNTRSGPRNGRCAADGWCPRAQGGPRCHSPSTKADGRVQGPPDWSRAVDAQAPPLGVGLTWPGVPGVLP